MALGSLVEFDHESMSYLGGPNLYNLAKIEAQGTFQEARI